jgi:F420H(2)-dependent quinone reductase
MVGMGLIDQIDYRVPEANWFQRLIWKVSSSRPGAWFFSKTLHHMDRVVLRLSRGRVTVPGVLAGLPVITLATTGARTGERREVPLVGVPAGDDIAVIGTRFGHARVVLQPASRAPRPAGVPGPHGARRGPRSRGRRA